MWSRGQNPRLGSLILSTSYHYMILFRFYSYHVWSSAHAQEEALSTTNFQTGTSPAQVKLVYWHHLQVQLITLHAVARRRPAWSQHIANSSLPWPYSLCASGQSVWWAKCSSKGGSVRIMGFASGNSSIMGSPLSSPSPVSLLADPVPGVMNPNNHLSNLLQFIQTHLWYKDSYICYIGVIHKIGTFRKELFTRNRDTCLLTGAVWDIHLNLRSMCILDFITLRFQLGN